MGGLLAGGGGGKGYVGPTSQIIGGGPAPPPPLFLRLWINIFMLIEHWGLSGLMQTMQGGGGD